MNLSDIVFFSYDQGESRGAQSLSQSDSEKLSLFEGLYLGIEIHSFIAEVKRCLDEGHGVFPRIELHF